MRCMRRAHLILASTVTIAVSAVVALRMMAAPPPAGLQTIGLAEWLRGAERPDSTQWTRRMAVAVVSSPSQPDKRANLDTIAATAERISREHPSVRLIVFGEASLGLYHDPSDPHGAQMRVAEPIPGPATDALGALARQLGVYLAVGLIERRGDSLANALVLLAPDGGIEAVHRKMLLHDLDVRNGVTVAAPNAQVIEVEGFRVGLAICADANARWLIDSYHSEGVDLLVYAVTSAVPWVSLWRGTWPMARHYGAWILAANRAGTEGEDVYPGTAFIAAPTGALWAVHEKGPGYAVAVVGK
ncbi:carbon-nitrogen hydrolase family protein [Nannocystis sp. ILAH1]|uniref:carbon-nitrogen hydrolase family protein n=1 Tax=Nannocystis sp. ILAH1 TaxID=2996789 RepID=UPI00227186C5|nr:carbon-nitrogen hydrolase family protein [Nannocystis sp. ILAH1]MCY0991733.1 carbon-nitrogen hydrolase family protein [Nannocystis sp. ILAH1]